MRRLSSAAELHDRQGASRPNDLHRRRRTSSEPLARPSGVKGRSREAAPTHCRRTQVGSPGPKARSQGSLPGDAQEHLRRAARRCDPKPRDNLPAPRRHWLIATVPSSAEPARRPRKSGGTEARKGIFCRALRDQKLLCVSVPRALFRGSPEQRLMLWPTREPYQSPRPFKRIGALGPLQPGLRSGRCCLRLSRRRPP